MYISKKNMEILQRAHRHANVLELLIINPDKEEEKIWIDVVYTHVGADDNYNWAGCPVVFGSVATRNVLRTAEDAIPEIKNSAILATAVGGCGYGSRQVAIATETHLVISAETCGGHWVFLVIPYMYVGGTDIVVLTDDKSSSTNWADEELGLEGDALSAHRAQTLIK